MQQSETEFARLLDIPVHCACGAVRGLLHDVSPRMGFRLLCYCDDCQAYAHYLGRPAEILDPRGGTQVFLTSPAHFEFTHGMDHVAAVNLTGRFTLRWYADCCMSPIGNTLPTSNLPYVGMVLNFADPQAAGTTLDAVFGREPFCLSTRFAKIDGGAPALAETSALLMILRTIRGVFRWRLQGAHRATPFFDPINGKPVASPRLLSQKELEDLRKQVAAWQPGAAQVV